MYEPVSRDLIRPSALSRRSESSSLDFSFIHSSTSGVIFGIPVGGEPAPISCLVTVIGEPRIISMRGAYGGGGGRFKDGVRRTFAGGRGRGVATGLLESILRIWSDDVEMAMKMFT